MDNEKIAEIATSWNTAYPKKKDVPRNIAKTCRAAMMLARDRQCEPAECLSEACQINGIHINEFSVYCL